MPGFLTEYTNNQVLDCFFGGRAPTPPSTLHIGLSLDRSYKGGYIAEPSGGSYARVAVPNDLAHFPAAISGTKANARVITFPAPTATWGLLRSVFIADEAIGGHVLAMADLPAAKRIRGGDPAPTIDVSSIHICHY